MDIRLPWVMILLSAGAFFVLSTDKLRAVPRNAVDVELQVALPLFVQVMMAAGDRNLAANLGSIRALVTSTARMGAGEYKVLGKLQSDVAWLNPLHEDNYYVAAAILPWNGELEAAQRVLARATQARWFDYQPAFYYAFNLFHFYGDAVGASEWMRRAAEKLPNDEERLLMQNFAARWMDRSKDLDLAIRVVEGMARQAKRKDFRAYLERRVDRLRSLQQVRAAAQRFAERYGRSPLRPDELVDSGVLRALPKDPFGFGFGVNRKGEIILLNAPPQS